MGWRRGDVRRYQKEAWRKKSREERWRRGKRWGKDEKRERRGKTDNSPCMTQHSPTDVPLALTTGTGPTSSENSLSIIKSFSNFGFLGISYIALTRS